MSLSKVRRLNATVAVCRYFPVRTVALLLYTLLILEISHLFCLDFKKNTTKFKNWSGQTGSAGPDLMKNLFNLFYIIFFLFSNIYNL